MLATNKRKIIILGAGISGLTAAWELEKAYGDAVEITIIDKATRVGGVIQTANDNGFLFELGPRSCRSKGSGIATLKLVEELGIQDRVLLADKSARNRFLWKDNKLQKLPTGPLSFLASPLTTGLIETLWHERKIPPQDTQDESIYDFFARRFSPHVANTFVDPLCSGIYAGDPHKLSMKACFPKIYQWEQDHGSVVRGMFAKREKQTESLSPFVQACQKVALFSFDQGMETLPKAIASRLRANVLLGQEALALHFEAQRVGVELPEQTLWADELIVAIPAQAFASLIAPHQEDVAETLRSFETASVAVVNLGYKQNLLKTRGFGYLVPSTEKEDILGCVWDSSVFPQQKHHTEETRLTIMIGGSRMAEFGQLSQQDFEGIALRAVSKHLGINEIPDVLAARILRDAIPQYTLGHSEKLENILTQLSAVFPQLTVLGNSFFGVSVNDCIQQAQHKIRLLVKRGRHPANFGLKAKF